MQRKPGNPTGANQHTKKDEEAKVETEGSGILDNVQGSLHQAPTGNSRDAFLRRLRKDAPEVHARVIAEELTPNAANCPHLTGGGCSSGCSTCEA